MALNNIFFLIFFSEWAQTDLERIDIWKAISMLPELSRNSGLRSEFLIQA